MQEKQAFSIYFDEAGRWPLAGPLFIGLICPLNKLSKKELNPFCDSKQISESQREKLFEYIEILKSEWKILAIPAWMTAAEIDKYGMSNALHCAILRWMIQIFNQLFPEYHQYPEERDHHKRCARLHQGDCLRLWIQDPGVFHRIEGPVQGGCRFLQDDQFQFLEGVGRRCVHCR
mgnify:CR=1 FL=1